MNKGYGQGDEAVADYFYNLFSPEDEVLREIRERSDAAGLPKIQVGAADARHLEVLVRFANAKKVVEIGTLGGYSSVCIARALPEDGRLYTFEYEPKHAEVARESLRKGRVDHKVEVFVGRALERLNDIKSNGPFDIVFIDADKINYPNYLAWAAENLRVGGAVIGDNTFAWGYVVEGRVPPRENAAASRELKVFNKAIATDARFASTILPTAEGLALAVKIR